MVSIIVPIYNTALFLDECLSSIKQQDYSDFEVLCIDDGSKDNSAEIVSRYVKMDKRFKLFQQENAGVSVARNLGLENATGEYICFVDSDDSLSQDYLSSLLELSYDGAFAVCGYARDKNKLGQGGDEIICFTAHDFIRSIVYEQIVHPNICMMLFKNNIIQMKHLDFTVNCSRNEDTEFYINYLQYEKNVKYSNKKCYYYRVNESSEMNSMSDKSMTSIGAGERIGYVLAEAKIIEDKRIPFYTSIQILLYQAARANNEHIYKKIHNDHDVRVVMKYLLKFPSVKRKVCSITYLILGKELFFKIAYGLRYINI